MERETRTRIQNATQNIRRLLDAEYTEQIEGTFDILRSGKVSAAVPHLSEVQQLIREKMVAAIRHKEAGGMKPHEAVADYIRDASFTTLNRFAALKMLEARDLVRECVSRGEESSGYKEFCGLAPALPLLPEQQGYRFYLESLFDELSSEIRVLFDRRDVASLLWPRRQALTDVLGALNDSALASVWRDDETIGWIYQYFNANADREKARYDENGKPKPPQNSRELAVRNQFFTPRYVVQFLVDNTLGRTWKEMRRGETKLVESCEYMVRRQHERYLEPGVEPKEDEDVRFRAKKDPRDLRILDPACGSGHFLLCAFDVLLTIYEEAWNDDNSPASQVTGHTLRDEYATIQELGREIAALILRHNLYGVEIDPRCAQIAALALWMRAQRAFAELAIPRSDRAPIRRTNIAVAEPMPGEKDLLEEFASTLYPPLLGQLVRTIAEKMQLAGELGVLLKIETDMAAALTAARKEWDVGPQFRKQTALFQRGSAGHQEPAIDVSGISDDAFWSHAERFLIEALHRYIIETANGDAYGRKLFAEDAEAALALIDLCRAKFDVVLMNPPFGELSAAAKATLLRHEVKRPLDAYAQFLYRARSLVGPSGRVGALVSKTFMSHAEFEGTREWLLSPQGGLNDLVELGTGVLDAAVEVAAIVLAPRQADRIRFCDVSSSPEKGDDLLRCCSGTDNTRVHVRERSQFLQRAGKPLAYRLNEDISAALSNAPVLEELVDGAWGLFTAADDRFVRDWWEVEPTKLGERWLPYAKGGSPQAFFAEPLLVVNWSEQGREILSRRGDKGQVLARAPNKERFGHRGLTYSSISSSGFRVRPLPARTIFSIKGPALFPKIKPSDWTRLLELLNTAEASYLLSTLTVNRSAELNYALRISVPHDWTKHFSGDIAARLFSVARWFASGSETSRYFSGFPLERDPSMVDKQFHVAELLDSLRSCGRDAYAEFGLAEVEVAPFATREEHLYSVPLADAHAVLSYHVGCAFGRWHDSPFRNNQVCAFVPDAFAELPRIPPAGKPGLCDIAAPDTMVADEGHPKDLTSAVLSAAVKFDSELCRSERRIVEDELRSRFFSEHVRRYSASGRKAPIYWQLATPSASYSVWLYAHRLTRDSFFQIQKDIVELKLSQEERELTLVAQEAGPAPTAQQRKAIAAQESFVDELRAFRDEIVCVAPLWNPNLDDGVVIASAPLWRLFPHQKTWQKELKGHWDELCAGKYDWSHLAMHLWPERVVPICATDRSIAIAHDLEEVFWIQDANGKWKPRPQPTRPIADLIAVRTSPAVKAALKSLIEAPVAATKGRKRK